MDIHRDGNLIEAGVWFVASAILGFKAWRGDPRLRRTLALLALVVLVFGVSDLVEATTGAWWRPWWLLGWKGACVLGLVLGFRRYFRLNRQSRSSCAPSPKRFVCGMLLVIQSSVAADMEGLAPKPVTRMQALPLPHSQISFERDGIEIARYHFDPADKRPFIFPIIGPGGRALTRMGHPRDPFTHSHHNSLWLSHRDVNGINFWEDGGRGQIRHVRTEVFDDTDQAAFATVLNSWGDTNHVLLWERRRMTAMNLASNEWMLLLDLRFEANREPVVLGKTSFGLAAVRLAKTIGVHDGGGRIRNSEGGVNEAGVHWKAAKWVDYSGANDRGAIEGITFFDHPSNPNHPAVFHVRDDGWMGAALTFDGALTIETNKPLVLRYGFYVHSGLPSAGALNARWTEFSQLPVPALIPKKR